VQGADIVNEGILSGTAPQSELAKLIDGKDTIYSNDGTNADCHF